MRLCATQMRYVQHRWLQKLAKQVGARQEVWPVATQRVNNAGTTAAVPGHVGTKMMTPDLGLQVDPGPGGVTDHTLLDTGIVMMTVWAVTVGTAAAAGTVGTVVAIKVMTSAVVAIGDTTSAAGTATTKKVEHHGLALLFQWTAPDLGR